jgi:hypothetical protein
LTVYVYELVNTGRATSLGSASFGWTSDETGPFLFKVEFAK